MRPFLIFMFFVLHLMRSPYSVANDRDNAAFTFQKRMDALSRTKGHFYTDALGKKEFVSQKKLKKKTKKLESTKGVKGKKDRKFHSYKGIASPNYLSLIREIKTLKHQVTPLLPQLVKLENQVKKLYEKKQIASRKKGKKTKT